LPFFYQSLSLTRKGFFVFGAAISCARFFKSISQYRFGVMQRYKNASGKSGIHSFEIFKDRIDIIFITDLTLKYVYTYNKPGRNHVDQMKALAIKGENLTTYINKNIRDNYERIERLT
jgi:hypothetical protein